YENVLLHLLVMFLMFIFVGLFEEIAFRAVINDAVIYRFRDKKYVFVLSAVCCSLLFGAAHVIGADLSSPLAWGQALGKTLSAGVFGLTLLMLYWKTRNIWACGVVHGVYDFLVSLSSGIFVSPEATKINYVVPDEAAVPIIILYTVNTLIDLLILWIVWKKIGKKIDYQAIRENW
ncbi:MAG: CPBP family intramembrane metalloprotease, partial [Lachnospiraceae bacterium]|nr:CPBP family intramembrane metalloprotease [Lachnospiraceae bacterium]